MIWPGAVQAAPSGAAKARGFHAGWRGLDEAGTPTVRCQCAEKPLYNNELQLYPGCAADATECVLQDVK